MSILLDKSILLTEKLANMTVETVGIFPRGHVTLIAGEPGIGKTWLMLSIAKSVAEGSRGIGDALKYYPKGKTLIFAGETGVRLLANRVKLMGGINPLDSCRVISSHMCANLSIDTMINTAIGRKNIHDAIKEFRPDITFFDTMISFMSDGKDESSQVDMTDALRGLGAIASDTGTAMVLLHHFRKRSTNSTENQRSMDEVIGSSAFTRLASLVVGIERKRELRTVRCLKSWWEEFNPFAFVISKDKKGEIFLKQDYNYNNDGSYSPSRTAIKVAGEIKKSFAGHKFSILQVSAGLDVSRNCATEAVAILQSSGEIVKCEKDGNTQLYELKLGGENNG